MMKITVVGTGYVGLVTGTYFANHGFDVTCLDISSERIEALKSARSPFFEPGLDEYLKKAIDSGRLKFTTDYKEAMIETEIVFICVGTPPKNGDADMRFVESAISQAVKNLTNDAIIVGKSTMPFGIKEWILQIIEKNNIKDYRIEWVVNPEFLSEGTAVEDMENPSRVVIGGDSPAAVEKVAYLYKDVTSPIVLTDVESAALIKYASNSFLATKVSFVNSLANVADKLDANVNDILKGVGLDPRIGSKYLRPGIGFGGSCLPKDIQAFYHTAEKHGTNFNLLKEVEDVNNNQPKVIVEKLKGELGDLQKKKIAILGLAFKPDTDDIRESAAIRLINYLKGEGADLIGHDPQAIKNFSKLSLPIELNEDLDLVFQEVDGIVLVTEWKDYVNLDWHDVKDKVKNALIVDGRNCLDIEQIKKTGFKYLGVGVR